MNNEPVAYVNSMCNNYIDWKADFMSIDGQPLYTHPSKELTDAQNTIRQLAAKLECYERLADASEMASNPMGVKSRVALRNVREMKTIMTKEEALAQPEQEPVAWMNDSTPSGIFARHMEGAKNFGCTIPLYTAPPQREWVGLTDGEIASLHYKLKVQLMGAYKTEDIYRAIETRLKEKNT
jgi:hypothetical protein